MNMNIGKFNPTVQELKKLVDDAQGVDITDLKAVKDAKKPLKSARIEITKMGKSMRDEATAFNRAVLVKERELLEIIEPTEKKFKEIEDAEKQRIAIEERKEQLPMRRSELSAIGLLAIRDEVLLSMNDKEFAEYKMNFAKKVKEDKEAEEKIELEKAEAVRQERVRVEQEAAKEEERLAKEKAKEMADKDFSVFLEENKFDPDTDFINAGENDTRILYRKVAVYSPKK